MPEVKNLDEIGVHADAIIDEDGCVYQFANTGTIWHFTTDVWEPPQQIDVIQDRIAEAFRRQRSTSRIRTVDGFKSCEDARVIAKEPRDRLRDEGKY